MTNFTIRRILAALCVIGLTSSIVAQSSPSVGFLDGSETQGKVLSIQEDGTVRIAGQDSPAKLTLMRSIETGQPTALPAAIIQLDLQDGGKIFVDDLSVAKEKLTFLWDASEDHHLPLDAVRRARLKPFIEKDIYQESMRRAASDKDQFLIEVEGEVQVVEGYIISLTATELLAMVDEQRASFRRGQVYGIIFAKPEIEAQSPSARIRLIDSSLINGNILRMDTETLVLDVLGPQDLQLPVRFISRADLNPDRLVFLSDLEPLEYTYKPLIAPIRNWQQDKAVSGRELTLAGKHFRKGLGMASGMKLMFEPNSRYDIFSVTVGIDSASRSGAECEFVVIKDRSEIFRRTMNYHTTPEKLDLDIRDADTVTLIVEYAGNLDLGDHANWADACFIKEDSKSSANE